MELAFALIKLVVGFAILIFGGEALVASAVSVAARFKVSPATIGLTVIAAGTSAPELLTSLMAALNNTPDIAVGNIIGSNIFNILGILGISAFLVPLVAERTLMRIELPALIGFTVLFAVMIFNQEISRWEGAFFLLALNAFLFYSIYRSKKAKNNSEDLPKLKSGLHDAGYLAVGLLGLVIGAHLALAGGVEIGTLAGLSERIIGITIISVGTGLPELATSAVAAYRGRNDIAVANVIGSNLMNTLGVTGVAATALPIKVAPQLASTDTYIMLTITALLWPMIWLQKMRLTRTFGALMLMTYVAYVVMLIYRQ